MDVLSPLFVSSVVLTDSSTGSPVHVLLSIQAVRGLPRMRAPGIVAVARGNRHDAGRREPTADVRRAAVRCCRHAAPTPPPRVAGKNSRLMGWIADGGALAWRVVCINHPTHCLSVNCFRAARTASTQSAARTPIRRLRVAADSD